jgi:polysaccharide export outer membrane protein
VPAPETPNSTNTVWRPVQRDDRLPERAVVCSWDEIRRAGAPRANLVAVACSWHEIRRADTPPTNLVAAAKMPAIGTPATGRKDIVPVDLQTTAPGSDVPGKDAKTQQTPALPPPRALEVAEGMPPNGALHHGPMGHPGADVPRELNKVVMPPYIIEPPDVLLIETGEGLKEQRIGGPHLVRPDGTVGLGIYGQVYLRGMTFDQAREAIADAIKRSQLPLGEVDPKKIFVDVLAYNSKFYYVITDGGGYGAQLYRMPITGNETVLDALSLINGLPAVSSKKQIWVARRVPGHGGAGNILPVDWIGLTQGGSAATNYQILPGDRLYVHSDKLIRLDTQLSKIIAPIERLFGVTLLGSETVNSIRNRGTGTSP